MNFRISADRDVIVNRYVRMKANSLANLGVAANHHVRGDKDPITDSRGWIDDRGRMNQILEQSFGMKQNQGARVSEVRILRAQDSEIGACDLDVFADIDSRSPSRFHSRRVTRV